MRLIFPGQQVETSKSRPLVIASLVAASVGIAGIYLLGISPPGLPVVPFEPLNKWVLAVADSYTTGGEYMYLPPKENLSSPGVTQDLYYQGLLVAKGDSQRRSYCSGLILEAYMRACDEFAKERFGTKAYALHTVTPSNFTDFRHAFYGSSGGTRRTLVDALAARGLGDEIGDLDKAEPGDLVQFWKHSGSGHCVVFKSWDRNENGQKVGLHYWSVQPGWGISEMHERVGTTFQNDIDPQQIWIVRALSPVPVGSSAWIPPQAKQNSERIHWTLIFTAEKLRRLFIYAGIFAVIAAGAIQLVRMKKGI